MHGPHTYALKKVVVKRRHRATFSYRVNALTLKATVTIKVFKGKRVKLTVPVGVVRTNSGRSYLWLTTITLPKGKYVWKVYAVDQKHRKQSAIGWSTLTVK